MQASGQSKSFFETLDLQTLSVKRSNSSPLFSLYLDLRSNNQKDLFARFQELLRHPDQQKKLNKETSVFREQWEKEADRIHRWLEQERPRQGKGLAVFSSQPIGLWQTYLLPVPVLDRLITGDRLYIRPLEILSGEFQALEQEMASEQEKQIEAQRVEELLTRASSGGTAVLGSHQTLLAVRDKRVRLLVVEEDFHQPGGECPNCGFMATGEQDVCLLCGMALRPEQDIIEVALKQVLDQGEEIEILRSPSLRHALEAHGRIGALLKDSILDSAKQQAITREGEAVQDVLRDETVDESFPASDPPGRH